MQPTILIIALALLAQIAAPLPAGARLEDSASLYCRTLLEQINSYRQLNGLDPLRLDTNLSHLARNHSFEMFQQKMISHRNFQQRFARSDSRLCVENVGWNYSTPFKQFDAWRQSSGHHENMLKENIRKAGIADVGQYVTFFACQ